MIPANFEYIDDNWKPLDSILAVKKTDPKELGYGGRDYQIKCFNKFNGKRKTIFIAPTGSGKSLVQIFNAAQEILDSDYKQKQVFIVPQLNIANGFTGRKHEKLLINKQIFDWEVTEDCCYDNSESVDRIKQFLLKTPICKSYRALKALGGCTAVVSYSAFLLAFNKMTEKEKFKAIKNTSFRPDEVHHISGVDETTIGNRLGAFCKFLLDNGGDLHLTTATFFRGDKNTIIGSNYLKDFEIFRVPFLEHWKTLGLQSLHQNYCSYKNENDLLKQILTSVACEPSEPPIIIVPADNTKFFKTCNKWRWIERLVSGLEKILGRGYVLDLVSENRQAADKKRLISEEQDFSAVVTCMIGREGTDWAACSRVHNLVLDGNTLQPIQKLGRALRQSENKTDVRMINYIEHFDDWDLDSDTIRARLSDRFNAIVAASMLDDMLYPILIKNVKSNESENKDTNEYLSLEDIYGSKRNQLIEDMMKRILSIPTSQVNAESIDEVIDELLDDYSEDMLEDVSFDLLKDRLRKEVLRRQNPDKPNLRINGLIVDFIREHGWDKVVREHIAHHSPFVGNATTKDLEELQKFLSSSDWMKNIEEIKKIGIENVEKGSYLYRFLLKQRNDYRKQVNNVKNLAN